MNEDDTGGAMDAIKEALANRKAGVKLMIMVVPADGEMSEGEPDGDEADGNADEAPGASNDLRKSDDSDVAPTIKNAQPPEDALAAATQKSPAPAPVAQEANPAGIEPSSLRDKIKAKMKQKGLS